MCFWDELSARFLLMVNNQTMSLIYRLFSYIYRFLSGDKAGTVDASGAPHNDGHALWTKLVQFNYQINDDSIPFLKQKFFNPMALLLTKAMTLDCGPMKYVR